MNKIFLILFLFFSSCCSKDLPSKLEKYSKSSVSQKKIDQIKIGKSKRIIYDITMQTKNLENITFSLSLPKIMPKEGLPCIFLIVGLDTGRKSLQYISEPKDYAIIAYEYPPLVKKLKKNVTPSNVFAIRKATISVPSQVLTILSWIEDQNFWDNKPISICGFSFGAIFVPAIYYLGQKQNFSLGPSIIAYGGANLSDLFYANFPKKMFMKAISAKVAACLFRPLEPANYLPHLHNNFLIINGKFDKNIPHKSAKMLQELTPEPKTIMNLDTEHLSPENEKLLKELNEIALKWLDENRV